AIYHQFDVEYGTTLWIITKGRNDIQQRFKDLTGPSGRLQDKSFGSPDECFRSSLAAHLMFCHWSTEDWRWYIRWLEGVIDAEVSLLCISPTHSNLGLRAPWPSTAHAAQVTHTKNIDRTIFRIFSIGRTRLMRPS